MNKLLMLASMALTVATTFAQEVVAPAPVASAVIPETTATPKKIAVFVQNRANVGGMDDEVDGLRDRLTSAFAEIEGLSVVDSALNADTFRRWKITTAEEKLGLVSGIYTGASVPNIAKIFGCDYVAAASIASATQQKRNIGGRLSTVYTVRMTLKIMDSNGNSVDGMPPWTRQLPIIDATDDPLTYYNMLFDQWVTDVTSIVGTKYVKWRKPSAVANGMVVFRVSTTIDKTIAELESQTKGAKGEQLVELRKVTGGATVELDGAVIGSCPGEFRATPGLHQMKVTRAWMKPYAATVNVQEGAIIEVALEMSDEGINKWGTVEALRADLAKRYAEAAMTRGIEMRMNYDTSNVREMGTGAERRRVIIHQD